MAQTPTSADKRSLYASPIGLLKNYQSINAPSTTNAYEQQFYKIKAQRLEGEVEELKEENIILRAKLTDSNANNQILKQRIFLLENTQERAYTQRTVPSFISDSGYPSVHNSGRESPSIESKYFSISITNQKSQRLTTNAQIQRLLKQNRVLKNQHQMEMSKIRDENKKLTRRIAEIQSSSVKKPVQTEPEISEKSYRQKQDERYLKIEKVNNDLRKQNEEFQKQKRKLEQRLKSLEEGNKALKRQNQQLKVLSVSKSRNEQNLQELQNSISQKERQYKQQIEKLQIQNEELQRRAKNISFSPSFEPKSPENSKVELPVSMNQSSKAEKQIEVLKRKISFQEQAMQEKDEEIKNILLKLKPLMEKERNKPAELGDPKRASLSILQVFLKKYKINSF